MVEVYRNPNSTLEPASNFSILIHRASDMMPIIMKYPLATRRLPSSPKMNRTSVPRDSGFV